MKENDEKKLYDLKQAAARLGMGDLNLRRKVLKGEISHYRPTPNGKIWFFEEHLQEFEKRRTFVAQAA